MRKSLLPLFIVLLLAGCGLLDRSANEIAICSSLPLNGGENARALSMSNAIAMAIEEQGSVVLDNQRYTLRYVSMDGTVPETGRWNAAQEERNARAAIAEHGCVAYIGTYNSGAAKISIPILNRVQMAMVSPGNTYPGLTKPGTGIGDEPWNYSPLGPERRNYCRVVPADDLQAPAAARYAAETLGAQRAFVFHDTELYGEGLADIFAAAAADAGIEVVAEPLGVGAATLNPDEVARTILQADPDLVYFGGVTANRPGEVLVALRRQGYDGFFMGADGIAEADFARPNVNLDDDRVFATLVGLPPTELQGTGAEWRSRYLQRYNDIDPFAAPSYEAAQVVITALQRAQAPWEQLRAADRADFLRQLRPAVLAAVKETRDFQGILGPWSFDENCDTTDTTISMTQAQNGDFQFVDVVSSP